MLIELRAIVRNAMEEELPRLDDGEELDEYYTEQTTITVNRITKMRLDEHRDGRPWDTYLEQLRREHADPLTINDVNELADSLEASLDLASMVADPGVDNDTIAELYERLESIERQLDSVPEDTAEIFSRKVNR